MNLVKGVRTVSSVNVVTTNLEKPKKDDQRFCRPCKENERRAEGIL